MKVPVGRHSSSTHHDSRLTTTRQLEVLAPALLAAVICGGTTGGCDAICCMICWKFSCKPIAKGDCSTCVWNWDRFMREVICAEECWRSKRLASKFYQLYQEVLTVLAFNVAFSNGPRSSTGSSNKSSTGQLETIVFWCILYIKVLMSASPFGGRGTLRVTMWHIQVRRNRSFLSTYAEGPRISKGIKLPHNVYIPG